MFYQQDVKWQSKDISGCSLSAIMNEAGEKLSGVDIINSIANLHDRKWPWWRFRCIWDIP